MGVLAAAGGPYVAQGREPDAATLYGNGQARYINLGAVWRLELAVEIAEFSAFKSWDAEDR